jgi:subtilase family serine protease
MRLFQRTALCLALSLSLLAFNRTSSAEVTAGSSTARPLIQGKVNDNQLVTLRGNTRSEARAEFDRGAVASDFKMEHMWLQLKRAPEQQKALDSLVDRMHTPGDPLYHQWLTPKEFGETFGVAKSDIATITAWLQSHGFTVNHVYPNGTLIDFSGTAGMVQEAFHTEIHNLVVKDGSKHFANMSDPRIPAALEPAVAGVVSMTNFFPKPMVTGVRKVLHKAGSSKAEIIPDQAANKGKTGTGANPDITVTCPATLCGVKETLYLVGAADFNEIYNTTPQWTASTSITGKGQTIAVVEDSDMANTADFTTFRTAFIPSTYATGTLTQEQPNSGGNCTDPGTNGAETEAALDTEWAGTAAPGANIILAACDDTDTATFGGLIALQNLINVSNSPQIFSMSYGECEAENGAAANAAFNATYEQAAAQGQSVFVSSGDSLAAVCDGNGAEYSTLGISVNGWGSTPYNVSVGGTDFGDTYAGTNSTYWSATNGTNHLSAKSYIPEIPWNNSCASDLIWGYLGYASGEAFCNSSTGADFLSTGGGSGGPSAVYAKPSWQSGFAGITTDGVRDMPDVVLFAANGVWNQAIEFCDSSVVTCNYNNATDAIESSAGGTSFASPSMAGIQALVNQKTGELQGDPNYILYALAKAEYGTSGSSACNSTKGNAVASSCVFYDITQGDIGTPCETGSVNCYSSNSGDAYGLLSTTTNSLTTAYPTTTGYDLATGIGSVNVSNLVNAWAAYSNGAPSVTVTTSPSSLLAGAKDTWTAVITGNGSYPTGTVKFSVSGTSGTISTVAVPVIPQGSATACTTTCSSTASYTYTVPGGTAAGTYTVTAAFSGLNEQYTAATGTGTYDVATVGTTSALTATPNTVAFGSNTVLKDVISWTATSAVNPTGNVVLSSSIASEGTFETIPLSSCTISLSAKTATCSYTWTPTYGGSQTITAAYSGDTVYTSSSATATLNVTQKSTSTTLTIVPSTVTATQLGTVETAVVTYTGTSAPTGTVSLSTNPSGGPSWSKNVSACTTNTTAKTITCVNNDSNAWNVYLNGTYLVTATYSGDAGDASSSSSAVTFNVSNSDTSTTTLTLGTTTSTYATGGTSLATVKVTGSAGDGRVTGTLTITGSGTLGTLLTETLNTTNCTTSGATAYICTPTITIPAGTPAGSYTITASYSGDVNYDVSSASKTYTIAKATPTPAAANVSGTYESTVTLSATDTGVTSGVAPTGTATFKVNGTTVTGTPSCSGSGLVETCTLSYTLPAGLTAGNNYPITASFATDTNYLASTTATGTLTVTANTASFGTMSFSPAATEPQGTSQAITISDILTFSGAAPTGAVTYVLNGVTYTATCGTTSPATCSATVPAATIAALAANAYTVTASLAAGGGYNATTGTSGTFTITAVVSGNITFSSVSHNFGTVQVGTAATDYTLKLTNSGTKAYPFVLNFTPANGFTSATNCPASIAAGANCEIAFYFTPTSTNTVTATWSLTSETGFTYAPSNGGTLTGTGTTQSGLSLSTAGHNWGTVTVGTTSAAYTATLSNSTSAAVTLTLGSVTSPFASITNCGPTLAAGASCQFQFTFTPTSTATVSQTYSVSAGGVTITSGGNVVTGIVLTGN